MDRREDQTFSTSIKERAAYVSYPFGMNILTMMVTMFLTMFYTDVVGLSTGFIAALFLAARIWDAVNDPLFGSIIDRFSPGKGKFKPWISIGIIAFPISAALLFINPNGGEIVSIIYAGVTYILCGMIGTLSGVPHTALATTMTDSLNERSVLMGRSTLTGIIGSVLIGVIGGPMIDNLGFSNTLLILAGAAFLTMAPIHFLAKERVIHPQKEKISFQDILKIVGKNKHLIAANLAYILIVGTSFATSIGPFFVKWNLGSLELMGVVMIFSFVPVIALPLLLPHFIRMWGKRKLYIYGISLGIIMSVVQFFTRYDNLPLFLVINGIKLFGIYLPVIMLNMKLADCAEFSAFVTGKRSEGVIFSIGAFSSKMGSAVSGAVAVFLLGVFGYDGMAEVQTQAALDGIWMLMSIVPVIGLTAGLIIFSRFYTLEEQDVEEMIVAMETREGIR